MAITLADDDAAHWLESVTATDLALHGVFAQEGETPIQCIERLAEDLDVDLASVGVCLALLRTGKCLLCGGAPMAMLAYSSRLGVYRACFDGECADELSALSIASAGVWLLLAAAELGTLPSSNAHWLIANLAEDGVKATNDHVRELAENYARQMQSPANVASPALDPYEALIGRAF